MGFFKKIFKGIGKVFKKVGRGIKKAFKSFGKFMGKIGFVGQMAMMFLFPGGIGNFLLKGLGKLGTTLATVSGNNMFATAVKGIGKILTGTQKFITAAKAGFSSITNGIMEFGKTALNKIPGINIESAAQNFFVTDGGLGETAWQKTKDGFSEVRTLFKGLTDGKLELSREFKDIKELSNKVGITVEDLKELNPNLDLEGAIKANTEINVNLTEFYKNGKLPPEVVQQSLVGQEELTGFRRDAAELLGQGDIEAGTELYRDLTGSSEIQAKYNDYLKERGADIYSISPEVTSTVKDYADLTAGESRKTIQTKYIPGWDEFKPDDQSQIFTGPKTYKDLMWPTQELTPELTEDISNQYLEWLKGESKPDNKKQGFFSRMFEKGKEEFTTKYDFADKPFSATTAALRDARDLTQEFEGFEQQDLRYSTVADILPTASIGTGDDPNALVNRFGAPAGTNMLTFYNYHPPRYRYMEV